MNKNKSRYFISVEDFYFLPTDMYEYTFGSIYLQYLWLVEGKVFIVMCAIITYVYEEVKMCQP